MLLLLLMMMGVMILVRYLISRGCQNKLKINSSVLHTHSHFMLGLNPQKCSCQIYPKCDCILLQSFEEFFRMTDAKQKQ